METFEDHLEELRSRLVRVVFVLVIGTAATFYFSEPILVWLQNDLAVELNALYAYEAFYTQLMISLLGGFLITLPYTCYEFLQFMKPGLTDFEYHVIRNYLPFSVILFLGGAAFAYNYVVKMSLDFFQGATAGAQVNSVWGLQNTIGFALKLSAFTGIMFQLPIVALILGKAGIIDSEMMKNYRNYFFVGVLLMAAMATPPDIITQIIVTSPVIILYQLSIWLVERYC